MTIELYRKMMMDYLDNNIMTVVEHNQIKAELEALDQIEQRIGPDDAFQGDIYTVPASDMVDLMSCLSYDTYGRLYIANHGPVPFEQYSDAVLMHSGQFYFHALSDAVLHLGYDTVGDLYYDNDHQEYHAPNGCSKIPLPVAAGCTEPTEQLEAAVKYLSAYELTNEGFLDKEDAEPLRAAINYLKELIKYVQ